MRTRRHRQLRGREKSPARMPFRRSLFWDVDRRDLDPQRHARYIIERVLDFGNEREVRWVAHYYSARRIRDTIARSRVLHAKSRSLWQLVFA